ncbi:MAG: helix-turn-helix transcriptional regulator, partial [Lachnospiraceae bacterium]|nr:helix-turn-helix transcriptional regulator [Lachnospiraceae bacterium]
YIANYYWRCDLSVPDIAAHLHIDRTYLYRLFKHELGISPLQYLTDVRMERAVALLTETKLPVQSVAGSVGYEDALYFSKTFKKAKGVSPSDYRNKVQ